MFTEVARTTWVPPNLQPLPIEALPVKAPGSPPTEEGTLLPGADPGVRTFTIDVPVVVYNEACVVASTTNK